MNRVIKMNISIEKKPKMIFAYGPFFDSGFSKPSGFSLPETKESACTDKLGSMGDMSEEYFIFRRRCDYVLQVRAMQSDSESIPEGLEIFHYGGMVAILSEEGSRYDLPKKLYDFACQVVDDLGMDSSSKDLVVEHFTKKEGAKDIFIGEIWILIDDRLSEILEGVIQKKKGL